MQACSSPRVVLDVCMWDSGPQTSTVDARLLSGLDLSFIVTTEQKNKRAEKTLNCCFS